ncbi:MAG TPA: GntR family transcriptional regulator [Clostridia bacterium]|nr:GntR family transcriptional regulator [Clostridia bacterium]
MLQIDPRSSKPLYEQIVDGIKENIVKGILQPGDKLPSVREMSTLLMVNPNTVSKAYQELERERAIETVQGRGTFISQNYQPKRDEEKLQGLKELLKKVVIEGHYLGLARGEIVTLLDEIYRELEER